MIISMDTYNSSIQMTSRKLQKISQTLYSFTSLCSHSISSKSLEDLSRLGGEVILFSIFLKMALVEHKDITQNASGDY